MNISDRELVKELINELRKLRKSLDRLTEEVKKSREDCGLYIIYKRHDEGD